ncbi:carbohydrate binding domain-containing protein [Streptomyces sp. NPDC057729]|uniref:carbohydrate binding domain-containing protein n=1 Tax=Streptomyces sp. NPDC057729 TaxID=3346230 RepID=UPI0036C5436B
MAFPETPLGLRGELLLGGAWTDITRDLYTREPIQITHGTASEGAQADPASCSLLLNNKSGRYSPRNPLSPYYGKLGRNTPVRVTVPGVESYLALDGAVTSYAQTPTTAALNIGGALDIRWEGIADWYAAGAQMLIGKWGAAGNRSYHMRIQDGGLYLHITADGTSGASTVRPLPSLPQRAALRATVIPNDGAGISQWSHYWAPTMDGPWTQIESTFATAALTPYASTAPLTIAPQQTDSGTAVPRYPVVGRCYQAQVRSGINGQVVADPDFRPQAPGAVGLTDSAGRTWTLAGAAEITDREGLFAGEVSEWPPRWSTSERDAWVPVQAAGILRRLGQGRRPLQSTLRRRIPSGPGLLAYWPMEDGETATQLYSPIEGVRPLTATGLDLAADDSLPGSAALPTLGSIASLSASIPATTVKGWQVEMVYRLPTMPSIQTEILRVSVAGTTMRTAHVFASTAGIRVEARDADGETLAFILYSNASALADFVGVWNRLAIYVSDNGGGQTRLTCAWRDVSNGVWWYANTAFTGAMGSATAVTGNWGGATQGMTIGHLSAVAVPGTGTTPGSTIYNDADRGYAREPALSRLMRLGQEEPALQLAVMRGDTTSEPMGPQGQAELMALVGEVVDTDGGVLSERMDRLGLVYRDRATLYNQTPALTLDYAAGHLAPPLEPVDDDAALRNDVTVTRAGGSSGRAVVEDGPLSVLPPEQGGVGVYEEAVTLSLGSDAQAQQIAAWRAHLGTWDEARYPTVRIRLHRQPGLIPSVLALQPGDLVRITNPPTFTGPGPLDLLVRQIQHQPLPRTWEVTLSCSPAGPYRVGVVGDPVLGRTDTDGASLASAATASATMLSVATTAGPLWVTAAPNTQPDPCFEAGTGTWTCTRGATIGIVTHERTYVHSGTGAARVTRVHPTDTGTMNIADTVAGVVAAAAGQTWSGSAWVYSGGATPNAMRVALVWRSASGAETLIYGAAPSVGPGVWTQLTVSATLPTGAVAVRLGVEGRSAWTVGEWWVCDDVRLARTDTLAGPDMADEFPFEARLGGEIVNVHGISGISSPQTFYIDRARNGIVKSHPAATDVRLATPTITAL